MKLNQMHLALTLGSFFALVHIVWDILVATGSAKGIIDFGLMLHQVKISYSILPFSLGSAIILVIVKFLVGYVAGWIFAGIWNRLNKKMA